MSETLKLGKLDTKLTGIPAIIVGLAFLAVIFGFFTGVAWTGLNLIGGFGLSFRELVGLTFTGLFFGGSVKAS